VIFENHEICETPGGKVVCRALSLYRRDLNYLPVSTGGLKLSVGKKNFGKITKKLVKSILENGGLAQLWSSLPLKFCKIFFKNSSPVSRTNPPEQIFKKKFQKNYWFDVVIHLEKSPKMTTTSLKRRVYPLKYLKPEKKKKNQPKNEKIIENWRISAVLLVSGYCQNWRNSAVRNSAVWL
jgi:hypothetical protein